MSKKYGQDLQDLKVKRNRQRVTNNRMLLKQGIGRVPPGVAWDKRESA